MVRKELRIGVGGCSLGEGGPEVEEMRGTTEKMGELGINKGVSVGAMLDCMSD
jgi:hypothetical protein